MRRRRYFASLLIMMSMPVFGEEQWLCVAERAIGFRFNLAQASWESLPLKTNSRYLIKRGDPTSEDWCGSSPWEVVEVNKRSCHILCANEFDHQGRLRCSQKNHNWFPLDFHFNKNSLTFQHVDRGPDFSDLRRGLSGDGGRPPVVEIGRCNAY